jgi:hypothetical protein
MVHKGTWIFKGNGNMAMRSFVNLDKKYDIVCNLSETVICGYPSCLQVLKIPSYQWTFIHLLLHIPIFQVYN